jgi:AbrB family looped-hinge helix DNA binding protein
MTIKGQITIPAKVRKALGLKPGVKIDFYELEDGEYALRPKTGSIMEMKGCLAYEGSTISIEEMDEAVRNHAARLDRATMSDAPDDQSTGEAA